MTPPTNKLYSFLRIICNSLPLQFHLCSLEKLFKQILFFRIEKFQRQYRKFQCTMPFQPRVFLPLFVLLKSVHSSKAYSNTIVSENLSSSTFPQISNVVLLPSSSQLLSFCIFRTIHYSGLWRFYFLPVIEISKCFSTLRPGWSF